jgi:uncharacterized protein YgbK (DUF1537 family)
MMLACIADDFTGAADLANTLTREGMRTVLLVGVPKAPLTGADADAVVVALKTRSIAPADAVAQSLAAYAWLRRQQPMQFLFKICSTFDSRFAIEPRGNIGPVAEALRLALGGEHCIPVCPAFPANGRTVFRGHLFVGDLLLSDSGMARHPVTPMTDANLMRVLQAQCSDDTRVALLPLATVRQGPRAIATALAALAADGVAFAIVDAVEDDDLRAIGAAASPAQAALPLLVGGSGIALGLPAALLNAAVTDAASELHAKGDAVLLAGSCSEATRAQIAAHAARQPEALIAIEPRRIDDPQYSAELADRCIALIARSQVPLVASSAAPAAVDALRQRFGDDLPLRIEGLFAALAAALHARGVRRFVVAGGETSGAVVGALGVELLRIGREIDPGVPVVYAPALPGSEGDLALVLKSGNFGREDFFARALAALDVTSVA